MITVTATLLIFFGTIGFSILYIISLQPKTLSIRIGDKAYRICGVVRMISMFFEMAVVAGYILFIFGDRYNFLITRNPGVPVRTAGIIITAAALSFMFYGAWVAGREAALPDEKHQMYTGIYNRMRHPQTLGEMVSWFGIAMILNSLTLLVFSVIWIPLFLSYTVIEDNDLGVRFGEDFIQYTKKVGAFRRKKNKLDIP